MIKGLPKVYKRAICRRHIRRSKLLLSVYARRSQKAKWLETHLWHAKRMKMVE